MAMLVTAEHAESAELIFETPFPATSALCRTGSVSRLRPRLALKERPELISDDPVDAIGGARVPGFAEQQLSATVAVRVDRVDQIVSWRNVEVLVVGNLREYFVQVAVDVLARNQRNHEIQVWRGSGVRPGGQHQNRLIDVGEIKDAHLDIVEFRWG